MFKLINVNAIKLRWDNKLTIEDIGLLKDTIIIRDSSKHCSTEYRSSEIYNWWNMCGNVLYHVNLFKHINGFEPMYIICHVLMCK